MVTVGLSLPLLLANLLRPIPEAGGRDQALPQALHHGREDRPAQLRPVRLAGEARAAGQEVPSHGGDRLPGPGHEGEAYSQARQKHVP